METLENKANLSPAIVIVAEQHIRTMLNYYVMRSLLDEGYMKEVERTAIRSSAIESRRYGFRLESKVERLGFHLDIYDEDRLRREAAHIARLSRTSLEEAKQETEQVIAEFLAEALVPSRLELAA